MVRVDALKCPECGAVLQRRPGASQQTSCEYCGALVDMSRPEPRPPQALPQQAAYTLTTASHGRSKAWMLLIPLVVGLILAGTLFFQMHRIDELAYSETTTGGQAAATEPIPVVPGAAPGPVFWWDPNRPMMFFDVNDDGARDPVGWIWHAVSGGPYVCFLAAYDSATGQRLWKTGVLADSDTYTEVHAALAGERLLVTDPGGGLRAYSAHDGSELWRAPMSERIKKICGTGQADTVWVQLADEREVNVTVATGSFEPAGGKPGRHACGQLPNDGSGGGAEAFLSKWPYYGEVLTPEIEGMSVESVVVASDTPRRFAVGSRSPGTSVPVAAGYTPKRERKRTWRRRTRRYAADWLVTVPTGDPMKAYPAAPPTATYAGGRLYVPFQMAKSEEGWRLGCLSAENGEHLWEVVISKDRLESIDSIGATASQVFVAHGQLLDILDAETGERRFRIGDK